MPDPDRRDVYFEFTAIGAAVRVTAIDSAIGTEVDSATGTEVVVMGPSSAAQADLQQLALGKLKARLAREQLR
jgi:hypothetical protein